MKLTVAGRVAGLMLLLGGMGGPAAEAKLQSQPLAGLAWGGYLQMEERILKDPPYDYTWHEYRLDLMPEIRPSEKVRFFSEIWIRSLGLPQDLSASSLPSLPAWLDVREGYVDFYDLIVDHLDLRLGKQRIAWGRGDKVNPTDNVNAYDLEDPADLGRHLGSIGMKVSYYADDFRVTGIYLPIFTPASLPTGIFAEALMPAADALPNSVTVHSMDAAISMPGQNPEKNNTFALKVEKNILGFDCSVSYVNGREDLPMVNTTTARLHSFVWPDRFTVDVHNELVYPRRQILGADIAGSVAGVGVWAEAACFFPEAVELITRVDLGFFYRSTSITTAQSDEPYVKFLAGADYQVTDDLYVNLQCLHGFFHERGREALADYLLFQVEWKILDSLKLVPLSGIVEVKAVSRIAERGYLEENSGSLLAPAVIYTPFDNIEFQAGAHIYDGSPNTFLGMMENNDDIFIKMKYAF